MGKKIKPNSKFLRIHDLKQPRFHTSVVTPDAVNEHRRGAPVDVTGAVCGSRYGRVVVAWNIRLAESVAARLNASS